MPGFRTIQLPDKTHKRLLKMKTLFGTKGEHFSFNRTIKILLETYEAHKYD